MLEIKINKGLYYTTFEEIAIPKITKLKTLRLAKPEEIDKIKSLELDLKSEIKKEINKKIVLYFTKKLNQKELLLIIKH